MNKIIVFLLLVLISTTSLFGATFASYPKCLSRPVKTLLSFPKADALLKEVQKEGKIKVHYCPFHFTKNSAMWEGESRSILLNSEREYNEGTMIRSLLFELHNAKAEKQFLKMDSLAKKGLICRERYIREIELIEHRNAVMVVALLNQAIEEGYYPKSAFWSIYHDFERHYLVQQQTGHSQHIGQVYDAITMS